MKEKLFIAGCARSGTSALVHLLAGSPEILIGSERYGHLVNPKNFKLTNAHFMKERFYNLEPEDTFYENLLDFHKFDKNFATKYEHAKWIGDKRPDLYESYDQIFSEFPNAKMIFIYRDINEVASSYQGRIQEGKNWPASKNFEAAVKEWNRSIYLTKLALEKGYDINVVDYHSIFSTDLDLSDLFNLFDVKIDEELKCHIRSIRKRSNDLSKTRKLLLSESELEYIKANAKLFLLDDIKSKNIFGV